MNKEYWTPARKWVWGNFIWAFVIGLFVDVLLSLVLGGKPSDYNSFIMMLLYVIIHEVARLKFNLKDNE